MNFTFISKYQSFASKSARGPAEAQISDSCQRALSCGTLAEGRLLVCREIEEQCLQLLFPLACPDFNLQLIFIGFSETLVLVLSEGLIDSLLP